MRRSSRIVSGQFPRAVFMFRCQRAVFHLANRGTWTVPVFTPRDPSIESTHEEIHSTEEAIPPTPRAPVGSAPPLLHFGARLALVPHASADVACRRLENQSLTGPAPYFGPSGAGIALATLSEPQAPLQATLYIEESA